MSEFVVIVVFIGVRLCLIELCQTVRSKQGPVHSPYFSKAVAMVVNAMESAVDDGTNREKPVYAPGAAGLRSTRSVDFHTGKPLHEATRCHLNAAVFDLDWERQAAELLEAHPAVRAWVKNDRLGLIVPYRKDGTLRRYFPDFIVELGENLHLIVEIKGQVGDAAIKKAAAERWCRAVTNDGRYGRWAYHLCFRIGELRTVLDAGSVSLWPLASP